KIHMRKTHGVRMIVLGEKFLQRLVATEMVNHPRRKINRRRWRHSERVGHLKAAIESFCVGQSPRFGDQCAVIVDSHEFRSTHASMSSQPADNVSRSAADI